MQTLVCTVCPAPAQSRKLEDPNWKQKQRQYIEKVIDCTVAGTMSLDLSSFLSLSLCVHFLGRIATYSDSFHFLPEWASGWLNEKQMRNDSHCWRGVTGSNMQELLTEFQQNLVGQWGICRERFRWILLWIEIKGLMKEFQLRWVLLSLGRGALCSSLSAIFEHHNQSEPVTLLEAP